MPKAIEVTAGIIVQRQWILVCQRAAGSRHAGKWEFPGGKREPGETLTECLRRELKEELGIVATVGPVLATARHSYDGGDEIELTFFAVERFEGNPTNRIFADMRWVEMADLAAVDFLEADREFVRQISIGEVELS